MIGYIKGTVKDLSNDCVVLETQSVGYEIHCSGLDLQNLKLGQNLEFWIHTHVREDAFQLFGFLDRQDKALFLSLLKVNGVGPKLALSILSGASGAEVIRMIEAEDVKALSKIPRLGKKTAEQLILTLKGKLVLSDRSDAAGTTSQQTVFNLEIKSALVNLGFRSADVDKVVCAFPKGIEFDEGFRQGLAQLSGVANK